VEAKIMAQGNIEGTQASRPLAGKGEAAAQSDERREQRGEQQGVRQTGGLQRRSPALPIGLLGLGGLSPFSLMRRMLEDMDRMFEGLGSARAGLEGSTGGFAPIWSPAIDVVERDDRFVVRADVPGLSPDDIRLEVRDGALVLEGERKQEIEVEGKEGVYRSERMYGRFARMIPLPEAADLDKVAARFENGVLEVEIPLREDAQRRRIEIQSSSKRQEGSKQQGPADSPVH
jgi:HSP20 family protein